MPIPLFEAVIPSCIQMLGATAGFIDKAEAWCTAQGADPEALLEARLAPDMHPLANQIAWVASHSLGAIEGVRRGVFSSDLAPPPATFDALRTRLSEARSGLLAISVEEMEGFIGRDLLFTVPTRGIEIPFKAESFLFSFSLPNLYFHAATAYDILRAEGVSVGKRDFLGQMQVRG